MTKEDAFHSDVKGVAYAVGKKYAELAVWEWADSRRKLVQTSMSPQVSQLYCSSP
jgi:hypothetical protein